MSCIALELLTPLYSFIMLATLLFQHFCQIPLYDVEPILVLVIMKILAHLCSLKHSPTVWIGGSLSFPRRSSWVMNQSSTVQLSASEKMMCQYCACCHDQQTLIMANLPFGKILLMSESQVHRIH